MVITRFSEARYNVLSDFVYNIICTCGRSRCTDLNEHYLAFFREKI